MPSNLQLLLAILLVTTGGTHTTPRATSSPGVRSGALMVYDLRRNELVLFGGATSDPNASGQQDRSDLWAWNGSSWRALVPVDGVTPPPRGTAHLVYDAARDRIIMFGGRRASATGGIEIMHDLWEWDGTRWQQAKDTLSILHATVTYDPVRRRIVMFGGLDRANDFLRFRKLREWDGVAWRTKPGSELPPVEPTAPLASAVMPSGDVIIVDEQSGRSSDSVATMTWTWKTDSWSRGESGPAITSIQPAASTPDGTIVIYQRSAPWLSTPVIHTRSPSGTWTHVRSENEPRIQGLPAFTYDAGRRRFVMYSDALWEWTGSRWEPRESTIVR